MPSFLDAISSAVPAADSTHHDAGDRLTIIDSEPVVQAILEALEGADGD